MFTEKFAVLMARHLTTESSCDEEYELFSMITNSPEQQYILDLLSAYWHLRNSGYSAGGLNSDEHFSYILARSQEYSFAPTNSSLAFPRVSILNNVKSER